MYNLKRNKKMNNYKYCARSYDASAAGLLRHLFSVPALPWQAKTRSERTDNEDIYVAC